MNESVLDEVKRYIRFGADDEARLRAFASRAAPHFESVGEAFYSRLAEHEGARAVLAEPAQVERHRASLCDWMQLLFEGPWDEARASRGGTAENHDRRPAYPANSRKSGDM